MTRNKPPIRLMVTLCLLAGLISLALAQEPADESSSQPAQAPSADDVLEQMLERIEDNPALDDKPVRPQTTARPAANRLDPRVLGAAPGMKRPKVIREGQFVINRRGRLVSGQSPNQTLFNFESDARTTTEAPMVLIPCKMLESMEDYVRQRGDHLVFVLTGQVFEYRGTNHLLPTIMRLDYDQGNLQK